MKRVILLSSITFIVLVGMLIYFIVFGVPIHDVRMWTLKRAYQGVEHPVISTVLADTAYLGGPATHGSLRCNYVIGEVRSASLSKQKIREAYENKTIRAVFFKAPLTLAVLFFDDEWPNELPWFAWESEFKSFANMPDTPYLVYAAQRNVPFLGDVRCDD